MFNDEFEKVKTSNSSLLSFNSFLSTSLDRDVSFMFAVSCKDNPAMTGILFRIEIDPLISSIPFIQSFQCILSFELEIYSTMGNTVNIHG